MKKRKSPYIDMTRYGPIMDISPLGYLDCFENFCDVLYRLSIKTVFPKKGRPIKVLVSTVVGRMSNPQRIEIEKTYSCGYLFRMHIELTKKPFDPETYSEEKGFQLEALKMQGQKEMAWAGYGQFLHNEKLIKQHNIIKSLPEGERIKKQKEFNKQNGPEVMRIGF